MSGCNSELTQIGEASYIIENNKLKIKTHIHKMLALFFLMEV